MFPHGIIAFLTAVLTGVPLSSSVIHINEMEGMGDFFSRIHYAILKRCDSVTVTGSKTRDKLVKHGIDPSMIFILPHAVDLKKFFPRTETKHYDILFLGRLANVKHPDTVIRAARIARLQLQRELKICIAGKGNYEYVKQLKDLCDELGMAESVDFPGTSPIHEIITQSRLSIYFRLTERDSPLPVSRRWHAERLLSLPMLAI